VPDFLFHAAPVMRGAAFQARFHVVFQIANNELGHRNLLIRVIVISRYHMVENGCKFAIRGHDEIRSSLDIDRISH
jgi:hypothetical protein